MEFMSNLSGDSAGADRPSLFELIAQDQMRDLLRPALRYLLTVYAERYPRYLLRAHQYFDEAYLLLSWLVERHYLAQWGASFSENFYGLKRARTSERGDKWTSTDVSRSLLFLVGLPYLKLKLDEAFDKTRGGAAAELFGEDEDETPLRRRAVRVFRVVYPWINAGYHGATLAYHIAYLYDRTRFYSPWLHLQGIEVRRMSMQDYEASERYRNAVAAGSSKGVMLRRLLAFGLARGLDWLKVLLPMGMFFFKFLEWWYASDYHKRTQVRPIPPPPEPVQPDEHGLPLPADPNICPICLKHRTNPAALPTGYAYCYPCIFHHVEEHGRCPVTLARVELEQIRKLYTSGI
ncbi:Pex12 amino terminal region-domain-containing protein [Thamnocephalis sphaerospora]|uniref:Peroxisome assembly protein 12 n=1 Tax=Thamnocephalis sphaerospora TaxID=78915 RepID=A0A4P9XWW4_9FUNG|nr:Pex12 amino terminal region-domain-containing protein [Thamnocephalis sphaerospora]|eukprot:RKP10482.1 Pex12 amino terminal region-domain-containing protein [Thamnocephalis sphaerospora]